MFMAWLIKEPVWYCTNIGIRHGIVGVLTIISTPKDVYHSIFI